MAVTNFQLTPLDPGRSFLQGQAMGQEMRSNKLRDLVMQQQAEQNQQIGNLKIQGMERDNQLADFENNLRGIGLIGAALKEAKPKTPEEAAAVYDYTVGQLGESGYDVSDLGPFSPEIMPKIAAGYNAAKAANLLPSEEANKPSIGTYNPRDYTTESFAQFQQTGDASTLKRYEPTRTVEIGGVRYQEDPSTGQFRQIQVQNEDGTQTTMDVNAVADQEAAIKDRVTRAQEDAKNATGQVREYFTQLGNIEANIANYAEAKRLVQEEGADTGAIASRMPSVRAAAVKLENLKNRLGLDVISNATFGALSEAEMGMALDTALPTGLEGPALVEWLDQKITAQQKLANYLNNAIQFLNVPGNSIADLQATNPRGGAEPAPTIRRPEQRQEAQPNQFTSQSGIQFTVE